jgi:hypothetical protein
LGRSLVRALWEKSYEDHEVGQGEQPLVRALAGGFRSPSDKTEMAALGKIVQVVDADTGQRSDLRIGENLLTGFNGDHWPASILRRVCVPITRMLQACYRLHEILSNSRSVPVGQTEEPSTFDRKPLKVAFLGHLRKQAGTAITRRLTTSESKFVPILQSCTVFGKYFLATGFGD